jgi:hypothetical protein
MKHPNVVIHDGNLAISIKNTETPFSDRIVQRQMFGRVLTDDECQKIFEDELDFNNDFTVAELVEWIENALQYAFPGMGIKVTQTGRSGGWLELTGAWILEPASGLGVKVNSYMVTIGEPFFAPSHAGSREQYYIPCNEDNLDMNVGRIIVPVFEALVRSAQRKFYEWVAFKMRQWMYDTYERKENE